MFNAHKSDIIMESGDIESNPGPTGMLYFTKIVHGDFHQSDPILETYISSGGSQCMANCIASIAYTFLEGLGSWTTETLNDVLMFGTIIHGPFV